MNLTKTPKQKSTLGDTELLIESMLKLIDHMSENQKHQDEIFETMTVEDIQKIIKNLDDNNNLNLRKTSAAFLCLLLYANYEVQRKFCQTLNIFFSEGKICVNQIPQSFQLNAKSIPGQILLIIKSSDMPKDFPLCWYYEMPKDKNFKSGLKHFKLEAFADLQAKQRVQKFFDPKKILFGFYVYNKSTDFSTFSILLSFQDENSETNQQKNRDSANSQKRCFSPIQKIDRPSTMTSGRKTHMNTSVEQKIIKVKSDKKNGSVTQNSDFFSFKKSENDIIRLNEEPKVELKTVAVKGKVPASPNSNSPNPSGSFHSKYTSTRTNSQMNHSFDISYSKDQKSTERPIFSNPFVNKQVIDNQIKTIHEEPNKFIRAPTSMSNPYYQTNTSNQKQSTKQKQINLKK